MPVVLDAYNVLHVTGVLPPDLAGLDPLDLAKVVSNSRFRTDGVWMVFDGMPDNVVGPATRWLEDGRPAPVRHEATIMHFSGPRSSADAVISELVEQSTAPPRLTIVSSDHAVQRHARRRKCRVMESAEFLRLIVVDHQQGGARDPVAFRPIAPLSKAQVEAWLKWFGYNDAELRTPVAKPIASAPTPPPLPALKVKEHGPSTRRSKKGTR